MSDAIDLMIQEYCQQWCTEKDGCRKDCRFYAKRNSTKVHENDIGDSDNTTDHDWTGETK